MKKTDYSVVRRKVNLAIGSMAISGVPVSRNTKANMLRIATGRANAAELKSKLVEGYKACNQE